MKYFVVSDVHGFYTPMVEALEKSGFFTYKCPKKLVVCGDMLDRGKETLKMQEFMMERLQKDELIFVRGNHEDLMLEMLRELRLQDLVTYIGGHHISNGTWGSAVDLACFTKEYAYYHPREVYEKVCGSDFVKTLIPASVDYFETKHYIFTHGYIPSRNNMISLRIGRSEYEPEWRTVHPAYWNRARWDNGMEMYEKYAVREKGKTIVCGHWHSSYGHAKYASCGTEFGQDACFTPYISKEPDGTGVMAIDACTAHSGFVNCVVLED